MCPASPPELCDGGRWIAERSLLGRMLGWPGGWDRAGKDRACPARADPRPPDRPSPGVTFLPIPTDPALGTPGWVGDETPLKRGGPAPLVPPPGPSYWLAPLFLLAPLTAPAL